MSEIRLLTATDAPAYQALRLKALQTNPESYLAVFESEKQKSLDAFIWEIRATTHPPLSGYYGLFKNSALIGYAQLEHMLIPKQQHLAYLYNLYVDPDFRSQGNATRLVKHLADLASNHGIERLLITCNRSNLPAQAFYKKLGFQQYAIREKSVKWQGKYDDELEMVKEL